MNPCPPTYAASAANTKNKDSVPLTPSCGGQETRQLGYDVSRERLCMGTRGLTNGRDENIGGEHERKSGIGRIIVRLLIAGIRVEETL